MLYALLFLTDSPKTFDVLLSPKKPIETVGALELRKLLACSCWHDIHKVVGDLEKDIYFL